MTGLSCPDCHGVLQVAFESDTYPLLLVCRIGHTFSAAELIMAKEDTLEHVLWSGITALEELTALLAELDEKHDPATSSAAYRARIDLLSGQRESLLRLLEENRPTSLEEHDAKSAPEGTTRG
jgi:two-component system chemotaxis response regulator CheB